MSDLPIQPIACVVGHPIAGNPMQFAMEQALAAADLDWRFLSLDVAPDRFEDAFRGMDALGFQGASIATPYGKAAARLLQRLEAIARRAAWVDCIARDSAGQMVGHNLLGRALAQLVDSQALVNDGAEPPTAVLIGDAEQGAAACHGLLDGPIARWIVTDIDPAALQIEEADLGTAESPPADERAAVNDVAANSGEEEVAGDESAAADSLLTETAESLAGKSSGENASHPAEVPRQPAQLLVTRADSLDEAITEDTVLIVRGMMADDQPAKFPEALLDRLHAPAMVVDMATSASTSALARAATQRGLQGITRLDLLIARAAMALELWTGQTADIEILREAFEEYLEI